MLCRFADWVDSWDDRINPVAVRDLRRLSLGGVLLLILLLALLVSVFALHGLQLSGNVDVIAKFVWPLGIIALYGFGLTYGNMVSTYTWERARWGGSSMEPVWQQDEMFKLTPMTPVERFWGAIHVSLILSLFTLAPLLPFLIASQCITTFQFWPFGILLNLYLMNHVVLAYQLSYDAMLKSRLAADMMTLFVVFVGGFSIVAPWIVVFGRGFTRWGWPLHEWDCGPVAVFLWLAFPLTQLLIGFLSYRLFLYQFGSGRSGNRFLRILANFFVIAAADFVCAVLFYGACFVIRTP